MPTQDRYFTSDGGGGPRPPGYWLQWNSCAPDNRAEMARANGGREAGWFLLDDLLEDPGILVGPLEIETCQQGVNLLKQNDLEGNEKSSDLAYSLSSHLLAAQLNLAVRAETCPAAEEAVQGAQLLLLSLDFDGSGDYLNPDADSQDHATAQILMKELNRYNTGELCVP